MVWVSTILQYFCWDSVRARTFVVFEARDSFVYYSKSRKGVQVFNRGNVWKICKYVLVGRVFRVEDSIKMLRPSVENLLGILVEVAPSAYLTGVIFFLCGP